MKALVIDVGEASIAATVSGAGPPLLLLHGFPQTRLMWRDIAPRLAKTCTVVCADLRGYGASSCPPSAPDHAPYSKRAMALDMVKAMARLGFSRFGVAGHDRGGRVAYRMALDHPAAVSKLAVLDVLPTLTVWEAADARLALAFWPWSLLAQAAPLPERLIEAAPEAVIDDALANWGSPSTAFTSEVRAAYVEALRDRAHIHAICEEYRAAAALDRAHDATDRAAGRQIDRPVLALWAADGGLDDWYRERGGPLGVWRAWAPQVTGEAMSGGHFFPEVHPDLVAARLAAFFAA